MHTEAMGAPEWGSLPPDRRYEVLQALVHEQAAALNGLVLDADTPDATLVAIAGMMAVQASAAEAQLIVMREIADLLQALGVSTKLLAHATLEQLSPTRQRKAVDAALFGMNPERDAARPKEVG